MSNFVQTQREIQTYIVARVPLIVFDTAERSRAEKMLRRIAQDLSIDISYYTDARQVCSLTRGRTNLDVDRDPLPFIAGEFKKKKRVTFVLGDCRRLGEDCTYAREVLNLVYLAQESNGTLIVISPDPVWPRLAQFGMLVRLDHPDREERQAQIEAFVSAYRTRFDIDWEKEEIQRAAALLQGFSETQIDNILASSLIEHSGLHREDLAELVSQKSRLYAAVPNIQPVQVAPDLSVAGLENLKRWLRTKQKIFFAPSERLKQWDLQPPRGILLVGVPGCGKSLSAKMVAREWGLPLFRFDLGTVYDKYVGESEKKMKEALAFLDNVSPCIVWVDEIEKALAVSDGGNDVGRRVLGQFLFWLQESGSRIFLVATANDIGALPSELFRKGRFSELFFVNLPTRAERAAALTQYCGRSLQWKPAPGELARLVEASDGFTYADIEYAVKNLAEELLLNPDTEVSVRALELRFGQIVPYSKTNPEALEALLAWGAQRAVNASEIEEE